MRARAAISNAEGGEGTGRTRRTRRCNTYVFNPKCITMGELYGEFNALTQEWTDGIASTMIRRR